MARTFGVRGVDGSARPGAMTDTGAGVTERIRGVSLPGADPVDHHRQPPGTFPSEFSRSDGESSRAPAQLVPVRTRIVRATPLRSTTMTASSTTTNSTLPRRILAGLLREKRIAAGISVEAARQAIGVSKQTFWRMETGQPTKINPLFISHLAQMYRVDARDTEVLLGLTEETHAKGWWHAFGEAIPKQLRPVRRPRRRGEELQLVPHDAAARAVANHGLPARGDLGRVPRHDNRGGGSSTRAAQEAARAAAQPREPAGAERVAGRIGAAVPDRVTADHGGPAEPSVGK
ncbi:hypothetical protein C5E43_20360 [Nocardia cyriacigeorgica]|nr:hypothetical protein C5E43_20360 [Nocardia cyriacigeorgica]